MFGQEDKSTRNGIFYISGYSRIRQITSGYEAMDHIRISHTFNFYSIVLQNLHDFSSWFDVIRIIRRWQQQLGCFDLKNILN